MDWSEVRALRADDDVSAFEGPLVLLVMDGIGIGLGDEFDAVAVARTPNLDRLSAEGIRRSILAHGPYVGLPSESDMGNSEVGHNTMGAGRIFDQGAKRIDNAISSGAIWGDTWAKVVQTASEPGTTLHLIGLLSDGGVHSSTRHLQALLIRAQSEGIKRVRIHVLLDGRDVPDQTADQCIKSTESFLSKMGDKAAVDYRIASGGGRMTTTMDRYQADWHIVQRGWESHVLGSAKGFPSALEAVAFYRKQSPGLSDQLLPPFTIQDRDGRPVGAIQDGDAVVFFNFRGDRAIEFSRAITEGDEFVGFDRGPVPSVYFAGLTLYDGDTNVPENRLVEPEQIPGTISEYLSCSGVTEFACAETQKFGHVTYFWNGNRSDRFDESTETYEEIQSDRVPFNERPWMQSAQTADAVTGAIASKSFKFIRANFAGGDMVGHTGKFEPTIIAVEAVDLAIGRLAVAVEQAHGCLVITADHGNAEDMVERGADGRLLCTAEGQPRWKTAHSINPIPLIIRDYSGRTFRWKSGLPEAGLANLAATLIQILGFCAPDNYDPSLVEQT